MTRRIVIPDDFPPAISGTEAEDKLREIGEVKIYTSKAESQEELIARVKEFEAIINIRAYTHLTQDVLEACPNLRLISIWGTGTDNVDLHAAKELGISVSNTPGANALSVAEHTIAILFAIARRIPHLDQGTRAGKWPRVEMVQLGGKVLGLLGLGAIGTHVARIANGLGMEVVAWTLHPSGQRAKQSGVRFVSKEELLRNSDVVSIHLRLSDDTRHFLKKEDFEFMKSTAFFINTARAGLVDPDALYDALQTKRIAGAALDVFEREPLPAGSPITELPNVVLTPHNAGMTPEATIRGLLMAVENVATFLAGEEIKPDYRVVQGIR
jgi:D-3-phosphoglycerate dehydrogenase